MVAVGVAFVREEVQGRVSIWLVRWDAQCMDLADPSLRCPVAVCGYFTNWWLSIASRRARDRYTATVGVGAPAADISSRHSTCRCGVDAVKTTTNCLRNHHAYSATSRASYQSSTTSLDAPYVALSHSGSAISTQRWQGSRRRCSSRPLVGSTFICLTVYFDLGVRTVHAHCWMHTPNDE